MNTRGAHQKKARNIANMQMRYEFLLKGLKAPGSVPAAAIESLAGQRSFAALELPQVGISAIALNTMKSLAAALHPEPDDNGLTGFMHFDSLRAKLKADLAACADARSAAAKVRRSSEQLKQAIARLDALQLQSLRQAKAYLDLNAKVNAIAKDSSIEESTRLRLLNMLHSHSAAFGSLFTPELPAAEGAGTVLPMHRPT